MARGSKRSRRQYAGLEKDDGNGASIGVGSTLEWLEKNKEDQTAGEWTTVGSRGAKRQKTGAHSKSNGETRAGKTDGNRPALKFAETHKLQRMLKIQDLQSLVLYCLADGPSPQFVAVPHHGHIRKAVVLMVPGLEKAMFTGEVSLPGPRAAIACEDVSPVSTLDTASQDPQLVLDYQAHVDVAKTPDDYLPTTLKESTLPESLAPLASLFDRVWPVKTPGDDKYAKVHSPLHAMLTSPLPKSQEEKKDKGVRPVQESKGWVDQRTQITAYIASKEELRDNDYVTHPVLFTDDDEKELELERRKTAFQSEADGWKDARVKDVAEGTVPDEMVQKGSSTAGRTLLAIDCEMCKVEGDEFALTRISIVGWDGAVLLDEYIKPDKPIIDYLTPYSGITPQSLASVTTSLTDIQERLLELFHPRTILIGHSLESDLRALKMTHPFIVDTSLLYPHPRGTPLKSSLKWLSQKYLSREIQKGHGTSGHDSIEDARATLDLVKQKCDKGPKWGSSEANSESIFKRLSRTNKTSPSGSAGGEHAKKTGAIVDHGSPERSFGAMATYSIGCKTDAEVVAGIRRAVAGDPDGAEIPGGGVDLTWARLRELEALRGWCNDNKVHTGSVADSPASPDPWALAVAVTNTVKHIAAVREALPPCTLLIVYSGTGDPREMVRLQEKQRIFKREYQTKKWDQLSVRWTDIEEQALRVAVKTAREGIGFLCLS